MSLLLRAIRLYESAAFMSGSNLPSLEGDLKLWIQTHCSQRTLPYLGVFCRVPNSSETATQKLPLVHNGTIASTILSKVRLVHLLDVLVQLGHLSIVRLVKGQWVPFLLQTQDLLRCFFGPRRLFRCVSKPSNISSTHHWGLSWITNMARYPWMIESAMISHHVSVNSK